MKPLHFSTLKAIASSPAHALFRHEQGDGEQTVSTRIGSAGHSLALGTGKRVVTFEGRRDKRTAAYQTFLADNADAIILNAAEFARASGIGRALRENRDAVKYLSGLREVAMGWDWLGRECATRGIDVIDSGERGRLRFVTELKTTKCAKPEWFQFEVLRRGYAAQLCWYEQALGIDVPELVIVAVESTPPHPVVVYRLSDRIREQARKQLRLWMELWLTCERSGEWPGYTQSICELDVPDETELDLTGLDDESEQENAITW